VDESQVAIVTQQDRNDVVTFLHSLRAFSLLNEMTAIFLNEWLFPMIPTTSGEASASPATLNDIDEEIPALKAIYQDDLTVEEKVCALVLSFSRDGFSSRII